MKHLCKKTILLIILVISVIKVNSQSIESTPNIIKNHFFEQAVLFPQEKIYAQIDKPYYVTGENIWFRAYLAEAQTHVPDLSSRYIYAELISPMDSVINRVKIRPVDDAYHGYISLDEDIPEGEYQLCFYTRYMEGLGPDYFFKRSVRIGDPLSALYRTDAKFEYQNDYIVNVEISIVDIKSNTTIKPEKMQVIYENNDLRNVETGKDNLTRLSINTNKKGTRKILYLEYTYDDKFHKQFIPVPPRYSYEVSFLPEGGHNIAGVSNRIGIKSLNSQGLGEDIEGFVVSPSGDTINHFRTEHLGMGMFTLDLSSDGVYTAVCRNNTGLVKKYQLPSATNQHIALQAERLGNNIINLSVRTPYGNPLDNKDFFLIIQCRGHVIDVLEWNTNQTSIKLSDEYLPSSIIQFLLVDDKMNSISERLIFNTNVEEMSNVDFTTDKENYSGRDLVKAQIQLSDIENNPLIASLSVSITDDKDVKPDSCVNILSTLLLTSDLKGHIESPAYYFNNIDSDKQNKLDLLMMTQGWSRYEVNKILKGDFALPKSYLELGQSISGYVKGGILMNRKSEGYPVMLNSPTLGIFNHTYTGDKGRFEFDGFEAPENTTFSIYATDKKGGTGVELILDQDVYPFNKYSLPFTYTETKEQRALFEDYIVKADENFVMENGMRMIYLEDIEVTGIRKDDKRLLSSKGESVFSSNLNPRVTYKEFEKYHPIDIFQVLRRMPGIRVYTQSVFNESEYEEENDDNTKKDLITKEKKEEDEGIRSKYIIKTRLGTPLILIDNIRADVMDLETLPVNQIKEIEISQSGGAAIFGIKGSGGAIFITTKKHEDIKSSNIQTYSIKEITPLGYQVTKRFYSPQYATAEEKANSKSDLRTTIYWNPDVRINEDGTGEIEFYTADAPTSYSVVIEGITDEGTLIHAVHKILRNN